MTEADMAYTLQKRVLLLLLLLLLACRAGKISKCVATLPLTPLASVGTCHANKSLREILCWRLALIRRMGANNGSTSSVRLAC